MPDAGKVYTLLGNENLWATARSCDEALSQASIPHTVRGGVAVCLHGYQRNTVDLDLIIRSEDTETVKQAMLNAGLEHSSNRVAYSWWDRCPVSDCR